MSLTLADGPLAPHAPDTVNYRIDGPAHRLLLHPFPRRVRATFGGETVLDTESGMLLHETGLLPQLYVPHADVRDDVLHPSNHQTHCPFKGDASYHSIRVGDAVAQDGVWTYREPLPAAAWLRGYRALYWEAAEAWFDEDEQVYGHLRDPYHRVDTRRSRRHVVVRRDGETLAESDQPVLLSETGLPNRLYLPPEDVAVQLQRSDTTSVCPYKGNADYGSLAELPDVAWRYRNPLPDVIGVAGLWCFDDSLVAVDVS